MRNGIEQQLEYEWRTRAGGPVFETSFSEGLARFCRGAKWQYLPMPKTKNDLWYGTDAAMTSHLDVIAANAGPLRLDFTHAFSHKDNMPLVWTPTPTDVKFAGLPLQYGIRVANEKKGFIDPVIVIGIDADRYAVNCSDVQIRNAAARNAEFIMIEAGEALSAFALMSEPSYFDYMMEHADYEDHETDSGIYLPDTSRFAVNPHYGPGQDGFTHKPSGICRAAIRIAKDIASGSLSTDDPKEAMDTWRRLAAAEQKLTPSQGRDHMSVLQDKLARLRRDNEPVPDRHQKH